MAVGNFSKKLSDTKVDKTGMSLRLIVFILYQLNNWTEDEVLLKKPKVDNLFWKGLKGLLSKQTCKFLLHKQWIKRVLSSLAKIWKILLSSQVSLCFSAISFSQISVLLKIPTSLEVFNSAQLFLTNQLIQGCQTVCFLKMCCLKDCKILKWMVWNSNITHCATWVAKEMCTNGTFTYATNNYHWNFAFVRQP